MAIIESLNRLATTLEQTSQQKRQITAEDTKFLLSAKFVDQISKTDNVSSLSKEMLKMNKVAYSLGLPEMAQTVNHLGQLKQTELINGKSERIETQRASALQKIYGEQEIAIDGEYKKMKNLKEFQDGKDLDPALQPDYFNTLAQRYKTETIRQLDVTDPENPMLKIYKYSNDSEPVMVQSYGRNAQGFYDDLLTKDTIENVPTPPEILDFQSKLALSNRNRKLENAQWEDRYGDRQNKPSLQYVQLAPDETGATRQAMAYVYAPNDENPNGSILEVGTGKDLTGQVTSKAYKQTSDAEQIKNADVRSASSAKWKAAWRVVNLLQAQGKVTQEDIYKYSGGGQPDPEMLILENEELINELEDPRLTEAYKYYLGREEHYQKVQDVNEKRQKAATNTKPDPFGD